MIKIRPLPSIERLHELLHYDPDTGVLTWKYRDGMDPRTLGFNTTFGELPAGSINKGGYVYIRFDGVSWKAHRVAWKMMTGEEPPEIDHINREPADNRWTNLRAADRHINTANTRTRKDNTSGCPGVWFQKTSGLYLAYLQRHKKRHFLGCFKTSEAAAAAYQAAKANT